MFEGVNSNPIAPPEGADQKPQSSESSTVLGSAQHENAQSPESIATFQREIQNCTLCAEVSNVLLRFGIPISGAWEKVLRQSSFLEDGEPDFTEMAKVLPDVALQLEAIYRDKLAIKMQYQQRQFTLQSNHFGECNVRMLDLPRVDQIERLESPTIVMPGCLTGTVSLPNTATALTQALGSVIVSDALVPDKIKDGTKSYLSTQDLGEWLVPTNSVNTAYTESVELAMSAYEELRGGSNDTQKYNLLGYSTSAAAVLQAALLRPEKVDKIVLLSPIGTTNISNIKILNVLDILVSAAKHTIQNLVLGEKDDNARVYFNGFKERQKERGWGEVGSIIGNAAVTDLADAIYSLIVTHKIPVIVALGDTDKQFPAKRAEANLSKVAAQMDEASSGLLQVATLKDFSHNHLGRDPEAFAQHVYSAFSDVEEKRS